MFWWPTACSINEFEAALQCYKWNEILTCIFFLFSSLQTKHLIVHIHRKEPACPCFLILFYSWLHIFYFICTVWMPLSEPSAEAFFHVLQQLFVSLHRQTETNTPSPLIIQHLICFKLLFYPPENLYFSKICHVLYRYFIILSHRLMKSVDLQSAEGKH